MTAKQKAARANFKKAIAEAKKIRSKNPKLSQAQAVKQAWAILYSKKRATSKVGAVKKAAKKKAAKKISEKSILNKIHKVKHDVERLDEAQHSHMITGVDSIKEDTLKEIIDVKNLILEQTELLERLQKAYKKTKTKITKERLMMDIKTLKYNFIPHNKRYLKSLQTTFKKSI